MLRKERARSDVELDVQNYCLPARAGALAIGTVYDQPNTLSENRHVEYVVQALNNIRDQTKYPFNVPGVVELYWKLAERIGSKIADYDLIVGDEISGILPAIFFWRLANNYREHNGLPPANLRFMNGKCSVLPPGDLFPGPALASDRALIATDVIGDGTSMVTMRDAILASRPSGKVDVAAYFAYSIPRAYGSLPESTLHVPSDIDTDLVFDHLYGEPMRALLDRGKDCADLHSSRLHSDQGEYEARLQSAYQSAQCVADTMYVIETGNNVDGLMDNNTI